MYLNVENKERPNKKVVFSQNMLKPLLDNADKSLIEEIAETSFQNGISDSGMLYDVINALRGIEEDLTIERRVEGLVEGVFSPDAQNWFEDIKYGWNGKILIKPDEFDKLSSPSHTLGIRVKWFAFRSCSSHPSRGGRALHGSTCPALTLMLHT